MAAVTSSLVEKTSISFAAFSGLKSSTPQSVSFSSKVKISNCTRCGATLRVVSQANGSPTDHSCADAPSTIAVFASVSSTQAAPKVNTLTAIPAALGAGVLGAAAVAFFTKSATPAALTAEAPSTSFKTYPSIPRATQAAPAAIDAMTAAFPTAVQEEAFVKAVAAELAKFGFSKDNNISLVNTCRDEVCRPLINLIDREFGLSFNISGLGGLLNCGKTGFKAAMSHSPEFQCDTAGVVKERYIFFAFPHVSVGETGEVGSLLRRGRGKASSACGALIAIRGDILKGGDVSEDVDDKEYVLLKKKVIAKVGNVKEPSLVDVTKAALKAITEDMERYIASVVDPATSDYAVITGVQIHSGNQVPGEVFRLERTCDYIAPDTMYVVANGKKTNIAVEQSPKMLTRPSR